MAFEYRPRKRELKPDAKRKRGRPRKEDYIEIEVRSHEMVQKSPEEVAAIQRNIAELQEQLNALRGEDARKQEEYAEIDEQKIRSCNILSQEKKEYLEQEIAKCESILHNKETIIDRGVGGGGGVAECFSRNDKIDKGVVYQKMAKAQRMLTQGTLGKISGTDQQKLATRKRYIEETLKGTLPSLSDCNSKDDSKTDEMAHYLIEHDKKYGHLKRELKNINKILDPDNPRAGSLEYLWRK